MVSAFVFWFPFQVASRVRFGEPKNSNLEEKGFKFP